MLVFYPLLLPVWEETYFRSENIQVQRVVFVSDKELGEQKKFFLASPDPVLRTRIIMSL